MAIRIIRDWYSIIINVDKVNKKVEGGLVSILSSYYPPKKKSTFERIKGLFSKVTPLTLSDFVPLCLLIVRELSVRPWSSTCCNVRHKQ